MTNTNDLTRLAEQFKGRADDCGRLARAILATKPQAEQEAAGKEMTDEQKSARLNELAKVIAHANGLGVRAQVCGDTAQMEEARRLFSEAKAEIDSLNRAASNSGGAAS